MNWIRPLLFETRILGRAHRTPLRRRTLRRRIPHQIPLSPALKPIKRMQQPKPMPHLMRRRLACVIEVFEAAAWPARQRVRIDVAAVKHVVRSAIDVVIERIGYREIAPAGDAAGHAGHAGLEVDVEGVVAAAAEGGAHGGVLDDGGPVVVGGVGGIEEGEGDVMGGVSFLEDGELSAGVSRCNVGVRRWSINCLPGS